MMLKILSSVFFGFDILMKMLSRVICTLNNVIMNKHYLHIRSKNIINYSQKAEVKYSSVSVNL